MFDEELNRIAASSGLRSIESFLRRRGPYIEMDGCRYIDFSSNDYLGLSREPLIIERIREVLNIHGMGSGGSRLLGGANALFDQLEYDVANFLGTDGALIFGSGYLANLGIVTALSQVKGTTIVLDKLCHASIIDGVLLSKARFYRFRHNDLNHLEGLLKEKCASSRRVVVIVESLYSMDGDIAPIEGLLELKERYGAILVVDEAHAIGVMGIEGRGIIPQDRVQGVDCIMGTFGKALGGYGAFCATSHPLRRLLINRARSFIFSTALPIPVVAWNRAALNLMRTLDDRRRQLQETSEGLRRFLRDELGKESQSRSQIVPLVLGESKEALRVMEALREKGIYVRAIRPPTVPPGTSRLRFSLSALHDRQCMDRLESALRDVF